jgi:outer membrane protein assembly factor BamB
LAVKLTADKPGATITYREDVTRKEADPTRFLMSSIIVREGHLYGLIADTGATVCADAKTGKVVWKSNDLLGGKDALFGSVFWVEQGSRVFTFTDSGDLVILKLNSTKYEEVARAHILDPIGSDRGRKVIWSHPAFAQQKMIVRNEKEIVCVSLAKG